LSAGKSSESQVQVQNWLSETLLFSFLTATGFRKRPPE